MRDWLPKSITSLADYSWKTFASDLVAGVTVGLVAFAAGHGVCDCVGSRTAGGALLCHCRGFPDFRFRRIHDSDWRTDWSVCRRSFRHRRQVWPGRPFHVHDDGGSHTRRLGSDGGWAPR